MRQVKWCVIDVVWWLYLLRCRPYYQLYRVWFRLYRQADWFSFRYGLWNESSRRYLLLWRCHMSSGKDIISYRSNSDHISSIRRELWILSGSILTDRWDDAGFVRYMRNLASISHINVPRPKASRQWYRLMRPSTRL
jgi:hypothetical protein